MNTTLRKLRAPANVTHIGLTLTAIAVVFIAFGAAPASEAAEPYEIRSPDNNVEIIVNVGERTTFSVNIDGKQAVERSAVSMTLGSGRTLGRNTKVGDVQRRQIRQQIKPVVAEKFDVIRDECNEMTLKFDGGYSMVFRAYDNGVAYRFQTDLDGEITVNSEECSLRFSGAEVYFPEEESFFSHNERDYVKTNLDALPVGRLASLPLLISTAGAKVLVAESALRDYPGMWMKTGDGNTLNATFPQYALESRLQSGSDRDVPVTKRADYIAKTTGTRSFPWRILALARKDADLLTNQLVYQLGEERRIAEASWIRPGKVAWDWWNANNLYGVDFRAGINTETYKHYIDFAASLGLEYVILDEGWYKLGDLLAVVPEISVPELVEYGRKKKVGIILWVVWKTLDDQLQPALDQFQKWGIKGIKVDFMQRDDQEMVNYYWKIAQEAAKRRMLVDYHGAYKPAGLRRAYPNVITREGVKGLEHNKWSTNITASHNLTLPFTRMVAGPMDYTPGAMVNAQPKNFRIVFERPMSMTTRAHQVAMYVVYESPLQMLADSPSRYRDAMESARFIARIPTTWDETVPLQASVGEYVAVARRNGRTWYIGAMGNENARQMSLDLSFLGRGTFKAEIFEDGINADHYASDYRKLTRSVTKGDVLKINLAPSGGWAAILKPAR